MNEPRKDSETMMMQKGIVAALVTPYDSLGEVDYNMLRRLIRYLLEQHIQGFYVCGSTSEAFLLSDLERKKILDTVCSENNGAVPVICHCGAYSYKQAAELSRHAYKAGANAISSITPLYYKYSEQEVMAYYADLSQQSELPLIVYNFPDQTGFTITADLLEQTIRQAPNISGVKHTSSNFYQMERMKSKLPEITVYNGYDEMLLSGAVIGADGAIGSTFNAIPKVYNVLIEAFRSGDMKKAIEYQSLANDFIQIVMKLGVYPGIKAFLELDGIYCHGCRKPFGNLYDTKAMEELEAYHAKYNTLGTVV